VSGSSFALAAFRQVAEAFTAAGGSPVEVLPSLGSAGGVRALSAGAIDLALASRPATPAESAAGILASRFASTPLAFVTRQVEPARELALRDVARILAGELAAWPEGTPVRLVRRQPSDSDWDLLASVLPGLAAAVAAARERPGVPTFTNDQDYADALERLPGAFGFLTLGQVAAEERRLRRIAVDGAVPSAEALAAGAWPLAKHLFVMHGPAPRPEAVALVAFLGGADAAATLAGLNYLPVGGRPQ
jgi:phosphate transport system substrate-binding protein